MLIVLDNVLTADELAAVRAKVERLANKIHANLLRHWAE